MTLYLHALPGGRFDLIAKREDGTRETIGHCRGRRSAERMLRHEYVVRVVRPEIVALGLTDSDGLETWKNPS